MEAWWPKNAIFQNFWHLKNIIFKLFGGPGGTPSEKKSAKNGSKRSVTPNIKKSLPFEPQKIAFIMIYSRVGQKPGFFIKNPAQWVLMGFMGSTWENSFHHTISSLKSWLSYHYKMNQRVDVNAMFKAHTILLKYYVLLTFNIIQLPYNCSSVDD